MKFSFFRMGSVASGLQRSPGNVVNPKPTLFISMEGEVTEPQYFEALGRFLGPKCPYLIQLVTEQGRGRSALKQVYDRLLKKKSDRNVLDEFSADLGTGRGDRFALVIDRDAGCHPYDELKKMRDEDCKANGFHFCLSSPCFELWLLLHYEDVSLLNGRERELLRANNRISKEHTVCSKRLNKYAGHNKTITQEALRTCYMTRSGILSAMKRARKLNQMKCKDWDSLDRLGTQVPDIFKLILPNAWTKESKSKKKGNKK